MPEVEADLFGDNASAEDIQIEEAQASFPTINELTNNDRFKAMPAVRKAYTLGQYRNQLAKHLVDIGEVRDQKQFHQALERITGTVNKHMPSGNSIDAIMSSTVDRREILSELTGLRATGTLAGKSAGIRNDFIRMAQAHDSQNVSGERFKVPHISEVEDYVKKFDTAYQDLEAIREGLEFDLSEDKDIQGRDEILAQGISASTISQAGSRMAVDIPLAIASSSVAGPMGPLAYYSLTGAARSDRTLRREQPDMSTNERLARAGGTGLATGSLEFMSFGYMTNALRSKNLFKMMNHAMPEAMKAIGKAALAEGATEFTQSYLEQFGHNVEAFDDFVAIMQDENVFYDALKEAGVGAILGGGVRGGVEIKSAVIPKILQTQTYQKARAELHKKLEKVDLTKRVAEPISDLSESIIKTSQLINKESKALEELELQRDAGQLVGEAIAEDATKRDIPTPDQAGFGVEVDGRFEQGDLLTASEAREQGEAPSNQESNLDGEDFIPKTNAQPVEDIIRQSILQNGGIDVAKSSYFKDSIQDADGNPVFSPKFKAKRGQKGLPLDEHIEILAADGLVPRDVNPDLIIQALDGDVKELRAQQNSQPTLEDLEILAQQQDPNTEFNQEIEDVLFFPDPDAKPDKVKNTQEPAEPSNDSPNVPVPKEAMPVPFNIDNDPKLKRDVTRKVRDIAKIVERDLNIPVRRGKFKQKALGIYKTNAKVVRTKLANDLQVIAHETGHALSDRFNLATESDSSFDSELIPLGEKTSGPNYTNEQIREEGRAEFFREYMVNPANAVAVAPKFHKAFTDAVNGDANTKAGVSKLKEAYADIVSQSAAERVEATIVQEDDIKSAKSFKDKNLQRRVDFTDKLAPLSELTKNVYGDKEISILKDPYRMARLGAGASDVANDFVEKGIYDSSGNKISSGLLTIFNDMSNDTIKKFDTYLKARRISVDLANRGITSGVQVNEANQAVEQLETANPNFKARANELKVFTDGLIEYSVREGVLTREEADRILAKNTAYIPFARAYDKVASGKTGTVSNPFQLIEGDTKDTLSGIAALENNVLMTVRAAANAKIYNALADMANVPGSGKFIEKVDLGGIDESVISFVRNGKRENYSVGDPLVYDALTYSPEVSAISTGIAAGLGKKASTAVNKTAIVTPPFIFKNLVRDTVAAGAQSKNNFIPVIDTLSGMMDVIRKTEAYEMFRRSGAGQSTFVKMLSGKKPKINKEKSAIDWIATVSGFRALEHIAQISEEATRVGDFKKTYKRMKDSGSSEAEAIAQAAFEARDLTIDFQKSGRFVQKLNSYVPFLNANIQGKIKTFQTLGTKKGFIGASLLIMAPEVLLWALLKDDKDYEEQPDHVKDNYWLIPTGGEGGEKFTKIPKPQGYNWFSNKLRNALNSISGKDRDDLDNLSEKLWNDLKSEAVSTTIPAFAKPLVEWGANYSFFRDQEIINQYLQKLPKTEQYNAYTSEVAKNIGPKIGIAPIYFDHLVYGYFTNWGKGTTTIIDSAFLRKMDEAPSPEKEAGRSTVAELSGLKSFLGTNPNYGAVSIQEIFERNDKISGMKNIMRSRDEEGKKQLISENQEVWDQRHKITGAYRQVKSLGKRVKAIYDHKTMTPSVKKKELRKLFDRMLEVSRKALDKK